MSCVLLALVVTGLRRRVSRGLASAQIPNLRIWGYSGFSCRLGGSVVVRLVGFRLVVGAEQYAYETRTLNT